MSNATAAQPAPIAPGLNPDVLFTKRSLVDQSLWPLLYFVVHYFFTKEEINYAECGFYRCTIWLRNLFAVNDGEESLAKCVFARTEVNVTVK